MVMKKNTEVAACLASRNSIRQTTNSTIESPWSSSDAVEVYVDFSSSMNSSTNTIKMRKSPQVKTHLMLGSLCSIGTSKIRRASTSAGGALPPSSTITL